VASWASLAVGTRSEAERDVIGVGSGPRRAEEDESLSIGAVSRSDLRPFERGVMVRTLVWIRVGLSAREPHLRYERASAMTVNHDVCGINWQQDGVQQVHVSPRGLVS